MRHAIDWILANKIESQSGDSELENQEKCFCLCGRGCRYHDFAIVEHAINRSGEISDCFWVIFCNYVPKIRVRYFSSRYRGFIPGRISVVTVLVTSPRDIVRSCKSCNNINITLQN